MSGAGPAWKQSHIEEKRDDDRTGASGDGRVVVTLSVALGYWVHPGFFLFTAFVGLNLFSSAFTNACRRWRSSGSWAEELRAGGRGGRTPVRCRDEGRDGSRQIPRRFPPSSARSPSGTVGFTVLQAILGSGSSGLKGGDRVHPGSSSLVFSVVPEHELEVTLGALRQARDASPFAEETRIWSFDVAEVS